MVKIIILNVYNNNLFKFIFVNCMFKVHIYKTNKSFPSWFFRAEKIAKLYPSLITGDKTVTIEINNSKTPNSLGL